MASKDTNHGPSDTILDGLSPQLQQTQDVYHMVRDRSVVLIGEASHGTEEFYRARARGLHG
jgi:erythromycin esterase-like protein